MTEFWALLRLDVRVFVRNPAGLLSLMGLGVLIGLSPLLSGYLDNSLDAAPVAAAQRCPDPAPPLAAKGTWPDWLGTADPKGSVVLEVTRTPTVWALSLSGGTDKEQGVARRCVNELAKQTRRSRRKELGVERRPDIEITSTKPIEPKPEPDLSHIGLMLGLAALALGASVPLDVLPRRRKTGMYETLRATGTPMASMTAAILALASMTSTLVVVIAAPFWMLTSPNAEFSSVLHAIVTAIPLALVVTSVSLRAVLFAMGLQEALLRWFGVVVGVALSAGLAWSGLREGTEPLMALVPIGGQVLASAGLLGHWWPLATAVSLATAFGLTLHCGQLLDADSDSGSGIDPTLLRHGRGNFLPEVLVLSSFAAAAGLTASIGAAGDHFYLVTVLGFLLFMMLPALLTPTVLNLPQSLLPTRRPLLRNLLAGTLIAAGMVGLGPQVLSLSAEFLPESPYNDMLIKEMTALMSDWRIAIGIGLLPGFCEEFLFRGAIQGLLQRNGRFWAANIGQALLFSLAHGASIRLLWTFLFGLLLGWVLHRCRTLWVGVWIHTLHNTLAVWVLIYLPNLHLLGGAGIYSGGAGLVLVVVGATLLRSDRSAKHGGSSCGGPQ